MKTLKIPFIALLSSADYKAGRLSAVSIGSTTYGIIDDLTIAREGNKLKSVSDVALSPLVTNPTNFTDGATNTQEYAYDGRGNLTRDDNKGITSITYNPLNLPSVVTFSTGATIQYFYRSDGVKLRTIHTPSSGTAATTNYCSNLVYDGTTLKMMLFDGGYATMSGSFPTYHYYLRDHLGSNRVLVTADGTVEQLIHYYPYGGEWSDASGSDIQPYKYTGKELDKTFSMNLYDYGARHYDPSLCSWTGQDPLGDKYYGMSSYGFCGGNPVRMVDVDGRAWRPISIKKENGEILYVGYQWIPAWRSFDENGKLLNGLYSQAIFFSHNDTFDVSSNYNIGSSTATVFLADGTQVIYDACTYPSDINNYATVPEGIYIAEVGKHKKYNALNIRDIDAAYQTIELGHANPAHPERTFAAGINIHKPGEKNKTGKTRSSKKAISQGCFLIDINQWNNFINNFDNVLQKNQLISVTVSRSMNAPEDINIIDIYRSYYDFEEINTLLEEMKWK